MPPPPPSSVQSDPRQSTRSRRTLRAESRLGVLPVAPPMPAPPTPPAPMDNIPNNDDDDGDGPGLHDAETDGGDDGDGADVLDITEDIDDGHGDADADEAVEEVPMEIDAPFDTSGLREIGNLACWTVSTYKPGCGVEALRDEDANSFWQSDGPQPHHLNIHFSRMVSIRSIRLCLDFEADESYTPTRITFLAGTSHHDLIVFAALEFSQPKGWISVPLDGVGGGEDGHTLRAFLVQVKVVENHQNGKDSHIRGLKIYAKDDRAGGDLGGVEALEALEDLVGGHRARPAGEDSGRAFGKVLYERAGGLDEPDWMGEPELR